MWFWISVVLCGGYLLGCLHGARIAQIISGVNLKQEGVKNYRSIKRDYSTWKEIWCSRCGN